MIYNIALEMMQIRLYKIVSRNNASNCFINDTNTFLSSNYGSICVS